MNQRSRELISEKLQNVYIRERKGKERKQGSSEYIYIILLSVRKALQTVD